MSTSAGGALQGGGRWTIEVRKTLVSGSRAMLWEFLASLLKLKASFELPAARSGGLAHDVAGDHDLRRTWDVQVSKEGLRSSNNRELLKDKCSFPLGFETSRV